MTTTTVSQPVGPVGDVTTLGPPGEIVDPKASASTVTAFVKAPDYPVFLAVYPFDPAATKLGTPLGASALLPADQAGAVEAPYNANSRPDEIVVIIMRDSNNNGRFDDGDQPAENQFGMTFQKVKVAK